MKQKIRNHEWQQLSKKGQEEILYWLKLKNYHELNLGTCIELLADVSHNLHTEDSDGRFFNNILINDESVFGWDGIEPITIIWYEIVKNIKKLLAHGRTLQEKIESVQ